MTARTDPMRRFEIKGGPIDVRTDESTGRLCLVFVSEDMQVQLFRTMCREEAVAFSRHLAERLRGSEP